MKTLFWGISLPKLIMRYFNVLLLLSFLFLISSCKKCDTEDTNRGEVLDGIVRYMGQPLPEPMMINGQIFPTELEVSFNNGFSYVPVDFSKYTVLALPTTASCSSAYDRNVIVNNGPQTVNYVVTISECPTCEGSITINNFVVINKVSSEYTAIFDIVRE